MNRNVATFSKRIEKCLAVLSQFVKGRACLKSMFRCQTDAFGVLLLLVVPVIFQLHKIECETVHKADANWHINIVKIFDSFIMLAILLPSGIINRDDKEIISPIFM